ncbi:MAG: SAM-dependent chlorinase/fluorinase [Thermodesulfobacteriota bacterium]|jgi:S-adenosylmethionine hydrolase|nr:MAG: SAM-dependent chlorinase/fluorinase [Thermodesulfobacteriota bacterium]
MIHPIITLLTDFGSKDHYVGAMRGVILGINPLATIVDITHHISPQNIVEGAFLLSSVYTYFPQGTIHLAVVDPGVGSKRKPILVKGENFFFIGPDNGIFGLIYDQLKKISVYELTNAHFFLKPVSATFHGRDIFAPVAAYLSRGVSPLEMGKETKNFQRLSLPQPILEKKRIRGKVMYIDSFGNLITNITVNHLKKLENAPGKIKIRENIISGLSKNYQEAKKGTLLAIIGSSNFLEISVREGSAQKKLKSQKGDDIKVY